MDEWVHSNKLMMCSSPHVYISYNLTKHQTAKPTVVQVSA